MNYRIDRNKEGARAIVEDSDPENPAVTAVVAHDPDNLKIKGENGSTATIPMKAFTLFHKIIEQIAKELRRKYENDRAKALEQPTPIRKNNTSGVPGVAWHARHNVWVATIKRQGVTKHLGRFENKDDAIFARREDERLFGIPRASGRPKKKPIT